MKRILIRTIPNLGIIMLCGFLSAQEVQTDLKTMDSIFRVHTDKMDSIFKIQLSSALKEDNLVNLGSLSLKKYILKHDSIRVHFNAAKFLSREHISASGNPLTMDGAKDSLLIPGIRRSYERKYDTLERRSLSECLNPDHLKNHEYYYVSGVVYDSVVIQLKNFAIQNLSVYTSSGEVFKNNTPISLIDFDKRNCDRIFSTEYDRFILIGELLSFNRNKKNRYYHGKFNVESITKKSPSTDLLAEASLNSLLRVKAFSDLAALIENEPNGVVQLEVDAFFPLNTKNVKRKASYLWHFLRPHIAISRFDNEFISLETDSLLVISENDNAVDTAYTNSVDLNEMYQRSWLRAGIDINFIHYTPISNHLELRIDFTTGYSQSNVTLIDETEDVISSFDWGIQAGLFLIPLDHFGFEANLELDVIKRIDSEDVTAIDNSLVRLNSSFQVFYENRKKNRIFLRWAYFDDLSNNPLQDDFSQLQFGYNASIKIPK